MIRNIKIIELEENGNKKGLGYADFSERPTKGKFFALDLEVCEVIEELDDKTILVTCENSFK